MIPSIGPAVLRDSSATGGIVQVEQGVPPPGGTPVGEQALQQPGSDGDVRHRPVTVGRAGDAVVDQEVVEAGRSPDRG
ncbi:hypothetical protein CG736_14795 [Kitasatospora sp. CB02891]|nr:hypothetical protein CG736_14795 [Kitasatospora sp. CB02891]